MRLSVNLNKIALLRNQRDLELPSVILAAETVLKAGAAGITVHPRPDQRHCRDQDVRDLRQIVDVFGVELNVEGNPQAEFMTLVEETRPHQVTLVPDDPSARTSDHGWDIPANVDFLRETVVKLHEIGSRVSLFMDYDASMSGAVEVGADVIELYTEPYADAYNKFGLDSDEVQSLLQAYRSASEQAADLGLQVHAGHDLNLANLGAFVAALPLVAEVSIGHAFTAEALWYGLTNTTEQYLRVMDMERG